MEKEKIIDALHLISNSIENDKIELYKRLITEKCFDKIETIEEFYFGIIYPYDQFVTGLIKTEISSNNDVSFILKNSQFIECHFRYWIEKKEGSACCADKTRTILKQLIEFYKTGVEISFDYNQEYTFHLPKEVFKTHVSIIQFYEGLKFLYYGNPTKYLSCLQTLIL